MHKHFFQVIALYFHSCFYIITIYLFVFNIFNKIILMKIKTSKDGSILIPPMQNTLKKSLELKSYPLKIYN